MANKNNKLDDFDFDSIDFDSLDAGSSSSGKKEKNNGPYRKMARSFGEGAREAVTDPQVIKRLAAAALPDGYGTAINVASDLGDGVSELYNNAAKELRPALPAMRKMAGKLADSAKFLPKGMQDRLKDFSKSPEEYRQQSAEEQQSAAIAGEIAGVFAATMQQQAAMQATDMVDRKVRERVGEKMSLASLKRLDAIRGGIDRLVSYQDSVTLKYQQKSLELQYRQLFTTKEMLALHKVNAQRDSDFYDKLLSNTAMSDGKKARFEQKEDGKLANRLKHQFQQGIVKHLASFGDQLKKNLHTSLSSAMQGVGSAFDTGDQMSDMMESGSDFGVSPMQMIAQMLGKGVTEGALRMASGPIRKKLDKNGKVAGVGSLLNYYGQNWQEHLTKFGRTATNGDSIWSDFLNLLKEGIPRKGLDNSFGEAPIYNSDAPAQFNMQTRRSINEVIPGYLMRIHHELLLQRDPKAQPVVYNMMRGTFTGEAAATNDAMRQIFNPRKMTQARQSLDEYINKFIDPQGKLSPEQREALKRQMYMDTTSGELLDPDRFLDDNQSMPELGEHRGAVQDLIRQRFKTGDKHEDWKTRDKANTEFKKLRSILPDPKEAMGAWREVGQKDFLIKAGLVDNFNGVDSLNLPKIMEHILKNAEGEDTPHDPSTRAAADAIRARADRFFGHGVEAVQDIYANGMDSPVLQAAKIQAGHYLDLASGKIIETVEDITGPVEDIRQNRIVVTLEQAFEGVRTRTGKVLKKAQAGARLLRRKNRDKLNKVNGVVNQARDAIAGMPGKLRGGMDSAKAKAKRIYSIYEDAGGGRPGAVALIDAGRLEAGEYKDLLTNKVLESVDDIKGPVLDMRNNRQVLRAEHFANGLVNEQGQKLKRLTDRVRGSVTSMYETHVAPRLDGAKAMFSSQGIAPEAGAQPNQTQVANFDQLVALSSTQVELLTGIYDILATRNFTVAAGQGGPVEAKQQLTWMQRIKNMPKNVKDGLVKARGKTWDLIGTGLRKATAGGMWLVGKGATLYGKYVKTVLKGIGAVVAAPFKMLTSSFGFGTEYMTDIWVKGGKTPALYAKKMKNGDYVNKDDPTKPIRSIKDIKGEVLDKSVDPPTVALTAAEYASGLYDTKGRRLGKAILNTVGGVLNAAMGGYGALIKLPFFLMKKAGELGMWGLKKAFAQPDVYVKSDMKAPRVRGILLEQGKYYSTTSKKTIYKHDQIDGQILMPEENNREVISEKEFNEGLVDSNGKPLGTIAQKLAGAAAGVIGFAGRMAGRLVKGAASLWGGVMGFSKDIFLGMLQRVGGIFSPKVYTTTSKKTNDLLESIHDMLDDRMPKGEGRSGSWQSQLKARRAGKGTVSAKDKKDDKEGGFLSSLLGKGKAGLMGLFGLGGGEEDDDDDGSMLDEASDATNLYGRFKGWRAGRKAAKAAKAAGGVAKEAGFLGKLLGKAKFLKKIPKGKGGALLALASILGMGALAKNKKASNVLDTATNVETAVGGAKWAARLAGMGGETAVGTEAAVGGASLAEGGAMAAGGILGAPLLPVLLGAAAVGYVGYKAFKKYKYGTYEPLRAFRMTQYGIDWNSTSDVEKMVDLEEKLQDSVRGSAGQVDIHDDKIKMDEVYNLFGISGVWNGIKKAVGMAINPLGALFGGGTPSRAQFDEWFNKRFKPVFVAWHNATASITRGSLNDADSNLKPEDKEKVLKSVNTVNKEVYQVMVGPFGKIKIAPTDIEAAYAKALAAVAKDKKNGGKKSFLDKMDKLGVTAVGTIFGDKAAGLMQSVIDKRNEMVDKVKSFFGFGDKKDGAGSKSKTFKGAATGPKIPSVVSALTAIRYRTYGLTDMDTERVRAVATLEWAVASKLKFSENGDASYDGDVGDLYSEYGALFNSGFWHRREWMSWFDNRFLPTLIAYGSAMRSCGASDILNSSTLKPEQQLQVAQATLSASSRHGFSVLALIKRSVWSVTASPWPDFSVNTDQRTTHDNMEALREAVKNKTVSEDKGKAAGGKGAKGTASTANAQTAQRKSQNNSFMSSISDWASNAKTAVSNAWNGMTQSVSKTAGEIGDRLSGAAGDAWQGVKDGVAAVGGAIGNGVERARKAAAYALSRAKAKSQGLCARFVADALEHAGYVFTRQPSAYMYATNGIMSSMGFSRIPEGSPPEVGDVIVYSNSAKHKYGHIQIFTGKNWVSDFLQKTISPYLDKLPFTHWRDMGGRTGGGRTASLSGTGGVGWAAVRDTILAAASLVGVPGQLMATMANIESSFNPNATNASGATGLFQFMPRTWKEMLSKLGAKYGLGPNTSPLDPRANALMGAEYLKQNSEALSKVLGRQPSDTELYLAHFMGTSGAIKFLRAMQSDPNAIAAKLFSGPASQNKEIFFDNGRARTLSEVMAVLDQKVKGHRVLGASSNSVSKSSSSDVKGSSDSVPAGSSTSTNASAGATPAPTAYDLASKRVPTSGGYASALDQAASSAIPTPDASAPGVPNGIRPAALQDKVVTQQREAAAQSAVATDMRSQMASDDSARQLASVTGLLDEQLKTQKSMDAKLSDIHLVLKSLKGSSLSGATLAGASEQSPNTAQPPARGTQKTEEATPAPISVRRSGIA